MADIRTAEWWEKQAGQFKRELDLLNPRLNVAEAQIVELQAAVASLERGKAELQQAAATRERELGSATAHAERLGRELAEARLTLKNAPQASCPDCKKINAEQNAAALEAQAKKLRDEMGVGD